MTSKNIFISFLVGLLFAFGLGLSGMTQPQKVIGFLDLFGQWNPSLLFVMVGAIAVHATYYFFLKPKYQAPVLAKTYQVPTRKDINGSLILGSAIFGVGWALGGYCPGPGITSLATFDSKPILFIVSMLLGMFLYRKFGVKLPIKK
jgi:uncharacterized membrane protein YedE/YeeE